MLIISGPTATGKTEFANLIAKHVPAEIVNMDVGQFYTPLSIGTAKPDWQSADVPHHLFDILDKPCNYSVVQYRQLFINTINDICKRGKLPIVVGGSGFYLKSLLFPPQAESEISGNQAQRASKKALWDQLHAIDPERAQKIDKNDVYRIERALDIWYTTGKRPSLYVPTYKPPVPFLILFLTRERKDLYKRIDERVLQMVKHGFIPEVERLHGTSWEPFIREKKIIGYNELIDYVAGDKSATALSKTIGTIAKRTRNYAKRQETFWRMLQRLLDQAHQTSHDANMHIVSAAESVNLTFNDCHIYIKQLIKQLDSLFI